MADRAQNEHARWLALKSLIDSGLHHADLDAVLARIDEEPDGTVADGATGTWSRTAVSPMRICGGSGPAPASRSAL